MPQNFPLVSVVIVNHNGIEFVNACLRSVLNSNYPDFEVIFVDNASSDGSLQFVKNNFATDCRVHIIENSESVGPAVGRNKGIAAAKGKYIAFLDNDTEVDASWLLELINVLEQDSTIGAAQSKLLKLDQRDIFDYAGDYLTPFGFLSERARGAKDNGQFNYIADIFSAKSASSIIRKDLLDKIGGFDEDYYMYLEETDLCWRVWLAGARVVFAPASKVYHAYGTKKKTKKQYYPEYIVRFYGCRNYMTTLLKNLGATGLIKILPLYILSLLTLSAMFMFRGKFKDGFWVIKAIIWNFFNIIPVLKKRFFIQKFIRKTGDKEILTKVMIIRPLNYYLGKAISYIYGRPY